MSDIFDEAAKALYESGGKIWLDSIPSVAALLRDHLSPYMQNSTVKDSLTVPTPAPYAAHGESKPKVPMAMLHELLELGAHRYGENKEQALKVQILRRYGFEVDDSATLDEYGPELGGAN